MLHLIVNPNAKRTDKETLERIEAQLKARNEAYDVYYSEGKGAISEHVHAITEGEDEHIIVAVGGDGTLNEALCGIADVSRTKLGLIPLGTGNDFAAAAHIPQGEEALPLILDNEPKFTDYMECGGGRRSLNIAGLGIDVDILERCERKKAKGKKGSYFKSLLASLCKYKAITMRVVANGEEHVHKGLLAAVCNGTQFGGGIPICPPASIDDGKLEVVVIDCPNRFKLPYYLLLLMKGKILTRKFAHRISCEEVVIVPDRKGSAQYDGELFPADELSVHIVSGKLRMYRG